ncbi:MAG: AtpZ/AtpI family protein [Armatimonadota bacterium]
MILIATLIGLGLGYFLDSKLGTKPWLAFIFTIFGLAAGIYESVKILMGAFIDDGDK